MPSFNEKRISQRYDHITPNVKFKTGSDDQYHIGILVNYSENGMYIKSNKLIDIGNSISLHMPDHSKRTTGPDKYARYSGQIKRTEIYTNLPGNTLYGYGLEYDRPVKFL